MRLLLERGASFTGYSYAQVEALLMKNFTFEDGSWLSRAPEPTETSVRGAS
jgi:hypothetical protein